MVSVATSLFAAATTASTLADKATAAGCIEPPIHVDGAMYKCRSSLGSSDVYSYLNAPDSDAHKNPRVAEAEDRFDAAFRRVRVGMTFGQVQHLGQSGNDCTDWPTQGPPRCGPLRYYQDRSVTETVRGVSKTYLYGDGRAIVYHDDVVVLIRRH